MDATEIADSGQPHGASRRARLLGRLAVVLAALMWSLSGALAKHPAFDVWPEECRGTLLAFWRAMFAAMILVPTIRRPRWHPLLLPLAACFSLMSVSYMTAMSRTTAANAIWLQATAPWWVFLFSVLLFREPIVRRDLIPLGFGAIGVGVILGYEAGGESAVGVAYGLAAGITYAGVVVCMRRLRAENSPWLVALNHGVAMLVLAPFALSLGHWPTGLQWLLLAALGILQMALPYLLFIRALRSISSQEAVAIGMLEPILIPFWAYLVSGEVPRPWTVAGAVLILVGLTLRYVVWEGMAAAARRGNRSP